MYDDNMNETNSEERIDIERQQGQVTYSDYVSYSNPVPPTPNKPPKKEKKKKSGVAFLCILFILLGLCLGVGGSYMVNNMNVKEAILGIADKEDEDDEEDSKNDKKSARDDVEDKNDKDDADKLDEEAEIEDDEEIELSIAKPHSDILVENFDTTGSDYELTPVQIADRCLSSVVAITNQGEVEVRSMWGEYYTQERKSAGSGVIIGKTDDELLILTNYHVVEGGTTLSVVFSWEEDDDNADDADIIEAKLKDYNKGRDIAVISIKMDELSAATVDKITVATVGSSDDLRLGEEVVAIGNALGYGQSLTRGVVSALNRQIAGENIQGQPDTNTYIQTDAAINPGNSGGALFNMRGELVGINSAKIGGSTVESMGYAIPISEIIDDVTDMMNSKTRYVVDEDKRGYLGVSVVDVTAQISATYGMPRGAYISSINEDSGAEKAGLEEGEIITAVGGKEVTSSAELKEYLSYYEIGDTVEITVAHSSSDGYVETEVDVVLGENQDVHQLED